KRFGDIGFPANPGLAQRDQTSPSWGEEHEHAELLVTLHLSREARARHDFWLRSRRAARFRRALRKERDANPLLLRVDAQNLECSDHLRSDRAGPSVRSPRGSER